MRHAAVMPHDRTVIRSAVIIVAARITVRVIRERRRRRVHHGRGDVGDRRRDINRRRGNRHHRRRNRHRRRRNKPERPRPPGQKTASRNGIPERNLAVPTPRSATGPSNRWRQTSLNVSWQSSFQSSCFRQAPAGWVSSAIAPSSQYASGALERCSLPNELCNNGLCQPIRSTTRLSRCTASS